MEKFRLAIRARHYSRSTEKAYRRWILQYIRFHGTRHPSELSEPEITRFLSDLATNRRVSASTQNQALSALLFLYREVLHTKIEWLENIVRAKRPVRLPVVLTREETASVLSHLSGTPWIMASLLYGAGLRLMECARLRVKDVDFVRCEITVRSGKGRKDRVTMLPHKVKAPLFEHLRRVRRTHDADAVQEGCAIQLPDAIGRKYPNAGREWGWYWVFPTARCYVDRETGQRRRHHLHESVLQRAIKEAARLSGLAKPASCHTPRHYSERRIIPNRGPGSGRRACSGP